MKLENVKKLQSVGLFLMQLRSNMEMQMKQMKNNGQLDDLEIAESVVDNYRNAEKIIDSVIDDENPGGQSAKAESGDGNAVNGDSDVGTLQQ